MRYAMMETPVGALAVCEEDGAIVRLDWGEAPPEAFRDDDVPVLKKAIRQLREYFAGKRQRFDLPMTIKGSSFQKRVWKAMGKIDYGKKRSYGDVARKLNSGPRAVGTACRTNRIPIIIPCHRIIASDGALGGYSGHGGLKTKEWLLTLEGAL